MIEFQDFFFEWYPWLGLAEGNVNNSYDMHHLLFVYLRSSIDGVPVETVLQAKGLEKTFPIDMISKLNTGHFMIVSVWSLNLQVETAVDITCNAMETRRRVQYHPSLQIPWDLVIIAQAHTVSSCEEVKRADCVSFTHVGLWNICVCQV